jgi:hypothetical protein
VFHGKTLFEHVYSYGYRIKLWMCSYVQCVCYNVATYALRTNNGFLDILFFLPRLVIAVFTGKLLQIGCRRFSHMFCDICTPIYCDCYKLLPPVEYVFYETHCTARDVCLRMSASILTQQLSGARSFVRRQDTFDTRY